MLLAYLGQKRSNGKQLIRENSGKDLASELLEIETEYGMIKEKQVKVTHRRLTIVP